MLLILVQGNLLVIAGWSLLPNLLWVGPSLIWWTDAVRYSRGFPEKKIIRTLRQKFLTLWRICLKEYVQMEKRHSRLHFGLSAKVIHRRTNNKYYNLPKFTLSRIRYFLKEVRSTDPWQILNSSLNTAVPVKRRNAAKRKFCFVFLKTAWFQHKRGTGSFMWHLHFQSAYQFFQ